MGMLDHLVILQRIALALLLGFSLAAFVCLIFLSGRGKHSHYDGQAIGPPEDYAGWVQEGSGRVPLFLKLWIFGVIAMTVAMTGKVIYHGFWY